MPSDVAATSTPASLASRLAAGPPSKEPRCPVNRVLAKAGENDRIALTDALTATLPNGKYQWEHLALGNVIDASGESVSKHRRGLCGCVV